MARFTRSILVAALLGMLAIPGQLAVAQVRSAARYTLIDLGTLGGPNSIISGPDVLVLNNAGMIGGIADTGIADTDSQNPNPAIGPDPYIQHAFLWRNGVRTDLGALPGTNSSEFNWINARGDAVGQSENGTIDPLMGFPAINAALYRNGHISNLGTLPGGYESLPTAINDWDLVVGFSTNAIPDPYSGWGAQQHAVLWQNGAIRDLGTLGGPDSGADYVNDRGQIAGQSYTNTTVNPATQQPIQDPFLWQDGKMIDVGTLGGTFGYPNGMNNRGEVVGQSNLAGDQSAHPFLWNGSRLLDLGTLGGANGVANWINDVGQVVGIADLPNSQRHEGFLWQNGTMTPLKPAPGASCSNAFAINEEGQAVGNATDCHGHVLTTVLWDHGTPLGLQSLVDPTNLHMTDAWDINDRGEIAGLATLPDGTEHAVLLVPRG